MAEISGHVYCACFREGKYADPPFPQHWLEVDEFGCLELKDEYHHEEREKQLSEWATSVCGEGEEYHCARDFSWWWWEYLTAAVELLGGDDFPVLTNRLNFALDDYYGSEISVRQAGIILREIQDFEQRGVIGESVHLVTPESAHDMATHNPKSESDDFQRGPGYEYGLSVMDFYVKLEWYRQPKLRGLRFQQEVIPGEDEYSPRALITDLDSGQSLEIHHPLQAIRQITRDEHGRLHDERFIPKSFHVVKRPWDVKQFEDILSKLKALLEASCETGNAVSCYVS